MYERYWRLQQPAFRSQAPAEFFYPGSSQRAALLKLNYLVEQRPGIAVVTGPAGVGKTYLLEAFRQQLPASAGPIVDVLYPQLASDELLSYLAAKLHDGTSDADRSMDRLDRVLRKLEVQLGRWTQQGRHPLILIDDAQLIEDPHVFQTLQQLLNYHRVGGPEFSIILCGQPELVGQVKRHAVLYERLAFVCALQPLSEAETAEYIRRRLHAAGAVAEIFADTALTAIARLSQGLPRRINRLCDFALLVGYADQLDHISATEIEAVASELCPVAV
uniref:ATPase n=1 Tax=Schlesneria paludicola TaxID=360056 RepID=A0A7C4QN72_9PLAN